MTTVNLTALAEARAARVREAWSNDWDSDALQNGTETSDRALQDARAKHDAALAKVSL